MNKTETFIKYYKNNYRKFFNFSRTFISDTEVCKDIVNDVFEFLWKNYESINKDTTTSYLYKIIKNKCLDHLKKANVHTDYQNFVKGISAGIDTVEDVEDYYARIFRALEKLTPYNRHILEECYFKKKKYKEVAEELNVSVSAIHKNIVKALKIIRNEVK